MLCMLPLGWAWAQEVEEEEDYTHEFTYGINFNTNGGLLGGASIKSTHHLTGNWYQFWALEGVEVKHPKEVRYQNPYTGGSFILGKSNSLFVLRPQYGREYTFFRKAAESGVQVNGIVSAGPSLAILAPYYIQYDYSRYNGQGQIVGPTDVREEQYDPAVHNPNFIVGSAGFYKGFSDPNFNIGANLRAGLSFEYGRYLESVAGIEVGAVYEVFPSELVLIPEAKNRSQFFSLYLTLFYGRRR